jgi:hypothetical protein
MAVKFTNNAATTLAAGINSSVTSIAVTDGSIFPVLSGGDHFYVTFDDTTNKEIVKVTARSGNTLTVVRGQDNTTAQAFNSGDKAELRVVAALLEDVKTEVTSTFSVDTFTGDDTTTAFTLSQAPSSEDNLIVFIEGAYQNPSDFVLSGTTLTFDEAPLVDRNIIVYHVKGAVSGNNLNNDQFTCNGSATDFTLSLSPIHENNTQVFLDGVYQQKTDYSVSGTTLTMDTAPANGAILEVMTFTQTDVNTLPASFVSGLTEVTAVGADHFMIFDATDSALKKSLVSDVLESATSISTSADATAITIDSSENVTFTNNVTINSGQLTAGGLAYPTSDGTNNQVLTTDGSGTLSFSTVSGYTDSDVATYLGGGNTINIDTQGTIKLDGNYPTGSNNVALGNAALDDGSLSGGNNTAIGSSALTAITSGASNTGVGESILFTETTGSNNTGVGKDAMAVQNGADNNSALGFRALNLTTTGSNNTAVGKDALLANTEGYQNTAVGAFALDANTTGIRNVALGYLALTSTTTAGYQTAIGYNSLATVNGGLENTALGANTLSLTSTGSYNTAIGTTAMYANTTGSYNVAVGRNALDAANTGNNNTAIGYNTLTENTTGYDNVAVGINALDAATTGYLNIAIGANAATASTGAVYSNTVVGANAATAMTSGVQNTCIGQGASQLGTSASQTTSVGVGANLRLSTGNENTSVGYLAGENITSAYSNVMIGSLAGSNATTSHNNVVVGRNSQVNNGSASNSEVILGNNITGIGSSYITIGCNAANKRTYVAGGSTNWAGTSDERLKTNIVDEPIGLDFINDLRPVKFKWKKKKDIDASVFPTIYEEGSEERVQETADGVDMHGFIAQELESTIANYPSMGDAGHEIFKQTTDGIYTASETALIPMLVKALQEADDKIDALTTRIEALES